VLGSSITMPSLVGLGFHPPPVCAWAGVEGAKKFRHQSLQWHEGCFKCIECTASIGTSSFIPHNGQPVCVKCYHDKYAFKCHKCHQVYIVFD